MCCCSFPAPALFVSCRENYLPFVCVKGLLPLPSVPRIQWQARVRVRAPLHPFAHVSLLSLFCLLLPNEGHQAFFLEGKNVKMDSGMKARDSCQLCK